MTLDKLVHMALEQDGQLVIEPMQLADGSAVLSIVPMGIQEPTGQYLDPMAFQVVGNQLVLLDMPL